MKKLGQSKCPRIANIAQNLLIDIIQEPQKRKWNAH